MNISVVIPYRNRPLNRVLALVTSFRNQTASDQSIAMEFILSDYGSTNPNHSEVAQFCAENDIYHVVSIADGLPWSRAHAINNGVRAASSEWLCIVDVDMVLMDPVFGHIGDRLDKNVAWFLESIWPQSVRQDYKKGVVNRSYGVFQVVHRDWFFDLNGFDERIEFWGGEDIDWVRRIERKGGLVNWLSASQFRLVHTWHEWENNPLKRPASAIWKTLELELLNLISDIENPGWGRLVGAQERQILPRMTTVVTTLSLEQNRYQDSFVEIVGRLRNGELVKLDLGSRPEKRRLSAFQPLFRPLKNRLVAFGLELRPMVNYNFENFLSSRQVLNDVIQDYFMEEDMQTIWLLGKRSQ